MRLRLQLARRPGLGCVVHQEARSTPPWACSPSGLIGAPSTYGTWGSAPDGTRGSVLALATGARAIAAPIAAAANHGAMYLIVVFMVSFLFAGSPYLDYAQALRPSKPVSPPLTPI